VKILAIRFARLGDVILLLPALASLKQKFPDSELTLLTGHRCATIAELCPAIDRVMPVDRIAMRDGPAWRAIKEMASLLRQIRRSRFDLVVDFQSFRETHLLSWLSGAPVRLALRRYRAAYLGFCFNQRPVMEDKGLHVAEMFQKVVDGVPSTEGFRQATMLPGSASLILEHSISPAKKSTLALYVDAPVVERVWPPELFAKLADFAIENLGAVVAVISGKQGAERAMKVRKDSRHSDQIELFTDLTLSELVSVIASAKLLVSNDTGPMHIGPAVGVPTLGLFSVGYPEHFRPTGPGDRYLRANPIDQIHVQDVIEAVEQMWATADRDPRR